MSLKDVIVSIDNKFEQPGATAITSAIDEEGLKCIITTSFFLNPVIVCKEGHNMEEEAYLKYKYGNGDSENCSGCPFCRGPFLNNSILNKSLKKIVESYLTQFPESGHERYKLDDIFSSAATSDSHSTSNSGSWESTSFYPSNAPANALGWIAHNDSKEVKTGARSRSTAYPAWRSDSHSSPVQYSSSIISQNVPEITTTMTQTLSASHSNSSTSSFMDSDLSFDDLFKDDDEDDFINFRGDRLYSAHPSSTTSENIPRMTTTSTQTFFPSVPHSGSTLTSTSSDNVNNPITTASVPSTLFHLSESKFIDEMKNPKPLPNFVVVTRWGSEYKTGSLGKVLLVGDDDLQLVNFLLTVSNDSETSFLSTIGVDSRKLSVNEDRFFLSANAASRKFRELSESYYRGYSFIFIFGREIGGWVRQFMQNDSTQVYVPGYQNSGTVSLTLLHPGSYIPPRIPDPGTEDSDGNANWRRYGENLLSACTTVVVSNSNTVSLGLD